MLKRFICTAIFILFVQLLWGQNYQYHTFKNIAIGPEATTINAFAQDSLGLMWLGTNNGLYSYDGFSVQSHLGNDTSHKTFVYDIIVINKELMCLAMENGIFFYNYQKDQYETSPVQFPTDVRTLLLENDNLWIGSFKGLFKYNLTQKKLEKVGYKGLSNHTIYSLTRTSTGDILIGTYNGLYCLPADKSQIRQISLADPHKRSNLFVNALFEDTSRNIIWVGTEGGIYYYDLHKNLAVKLPILQDHSVKSLITDNRNKLLIGTDAGFYIYSPDTEQLERIVHDARNKGSIVNNIIWSLFADKESNIWLGTDYGISLLQNQNSLQVIPIFEITHEKDGNRLYNIYKDTYGDYWLGGTNGIIRASSPGAHEVLSAWYKMGDKALPISHNRIRDIFEDKDRNVWVATDGGINRFDHQAKAFVNYNIIDSSQSRNANWAYSIQEDAQKRLWIATYLGGIFVVDRSQLTGGTNREVPHHTAAPDMGLNNPAIIAVHNLAAHNGLAGNSVNQLARDQQGNIWALIYNRAIHKIDPLTFHVATVMDGSKHPSYMIADDAGVIWIGCQESISRIKDGQIKTIPFNAGGILSMEQVAGNIWISTSEGIWMMDRHTTTVKRFNSSQSAFTSIYYDRDLHEVYLGGADELGIAATAIQTATGAGTKLCLTALYINGKLTGSVRYKDEIRLNHEQNNLAFAISDLNYSDPEGSRYVYRITQLDDDWITLPLNNNLITYNNLNYGNYTLLVSKLDAYGKPYANPLKLSITIIPPWYYTNLAKAIYFLIVVGLVLWAINFFRVRHNLKIERIEKQKTVELTNLKLNFFADISHELKTPLSLILAPVSQMLAETRSPLKKKQLEGIQQNALKLNGLIHRVLNFNRADSNALSALVLSKLELVAFGRKLYEAFISKNRAFTFTCNKEEIYIDTDIIRTEAIISNLLSNACRYTNDGGAIHLDIHQKNNAVAISVADTGIGIPAAELPYVFERFFKSSITARNKEGSGIGLYLVKNYAEQLGGYVNITSVEGEGTNVTVTLPVPEKEVLPVPKEERLLPGNQEHNDNPPEKPLRKKVLIVDDNQEITEFLQQALAAQYQTQTAPDGKKGEALSIEWQPDLIIVDVMMPVMDGLEMSKRLKKQVMTATIPIILLTAKDDRKTELESIDLGADTFMSKPFDISILLSRIEQLLKRREDMESQLRISALTDPTEEKALSRDEEFLSNITRIIEEKMDDPQFNVQVLGDLSFTNSRQLYRKIKQLTSLTPVEYIRSIRMKKAAVLLQKNKFSVAEVMYMVGFSEASYFSKCFQAEFGQTPSRFVKNNL
ncbi:two-component regulator propeller domain-containing protein [Chitinophaga sancti]|uniref:histidine kinase n=1 Tax=Chitinophaga sancti TaxID=1004 RepID=A0A1K1SU12_9BACT|nr:two-component regulator propeller domain-containing protein [Chitinophaga sancti]WQD60823.1 two-component regulator propeller domain-containing protein [Chitinophaga sancti]WQG87049.1 two-component regulator propeller domain-containing protein [Chitinophaga sancti]SFW87724.1 Two component regulator propeller [Chitinophaga sancti]